MPTEPRADVSNMEVVTSITESQSAFHQRDLTVKSLDSNFQLDIETMIYVFKKSIPLWSMDVSFSMSYFSQPKDVLSIKVCA